MNRQNLIVASVCLASFVSVESRGSADADAKRGLTLERRGTAAAVGQFAQMLGDGENVSIGHTIKTRMTPEIEEGVRRACRTFWK